MFYLKWHFNRWPVELNNIIVFQRSTAGQCLSIYKDNLSILSLIGILKKVVFYLYNSTI